MTTRRIAQVFRSVPTVGGAGVHLKGADIPEVLLEGGDSREELRIAFEEFHSGTFIE